MVDIVPALLVVAALAAALWFLQRRLIGPAPSRSRTLLRLLAILLVAFALIGYGAFRLCKAPNIQLLGDLVTHAHVSQKVVALTFDDGPRPVYTDRVIDLLEAHDAKGTFFVTGGEASDSPESLRALVAAGEEIGNHTWSHRRLLALSQQTIAEEIERTDAVIRDAGYSGAIVVRPPNGKRLLAAPWYLWRHGRTTVTWSLAPDSLPNIADDADAMVAYVLGHVRPGDIILMHVMHENRSASRAALPRLLEALTARGYRFVTVSELLRLRDEQD